MSPKNLRDRLFVSTYRMCFALRLATLPPAIRPCYRRRQHYDIRNWRGRLQCNDNIRLLRRRRQLMAAYHDNFEEEYHDR